MFPSKSNLKSEFFQMFFFTVLAPDFVSLLLSISISISIYLSLSLSLSLLFDYRTYNEYIQMYDNIMSLN